MATWLYKNGGWLSVFVAPGGHFSPHDIFLQRKIKIKKETPYFYTM
jgi:hypothetical protein